MPVADKGYSRRHHRGAPTWACACSSLLQEAAESSRVELLKAARISECCGCLCFQHKIRLHFDCPDDCPTMRQALQDPSRISFEGPRPGYIAGNILTALFGLSKALSSASVLYAAPRTSICSVYQGCSSAIDLHCFLLIVIMVSLTDHHPRGWGFKRCAQLLAAVAC